MGMIVLTEGYMDTITMHEYGFDCAVASLGTSLTQEQAGMLAKYTDQKLVAAKVREVDSGVNIVPVQLGILQNSGETINIILKMRRNNRTGDWKAFDLIAENVSILDAKSAELNPIIQQQGIGAEITALRPNEAQIGKK